MTTRTPTLPPDLRPDCSACCGLCCVAPAFDAAQGFGFDKPAHTPCVNLQSDYRCAIHDNLSVNGFPGCIVFDCHGAGQRVTRQVFHGVSWSDSPHIAVKMFNAFGRFCVLHELMALLSIARQRFVEENIQTRLKTSLYEIEALCQEESVSPGSVDIAGIKRTTMNMLRGLESTAAAALKL